MKKSDLNMLCLALVTMGSTFGIGSIVVYFFGEAHSLLFMFLGWTLLLGGGLPLLTYALKEDKKNKKGVFKEG